MNNVQRARTLTGQREKARALSNVSEVVSNAFKGAPKQYEAVIAKEVALLKMADNQMNMAKQSQTAALERLAALSKKITEESK